MFNYGTIREFRTANFRVIVDAIEDDSTLNDLHFEPEAQEEIRAKLESGEWLNFCARARVFFDGEEIASDYLGGCIYPSPEAFMDHKECGKQNREYAARGESGRCGSYFRQMIDDVCQQAREHLRKAQSVRVR